MTNQPPPSDPYRDPTGNQPPISPGPQPEQPYSAPPASPAPGYGPPTSPGPYPPPMYGPPPGYPMQPPVKKSFWKSPGGITLIIALAIIVPCLGCIGFGTFGSILDDSAASKMDASITSCKFTGGPLSSAVVGISVKNNGDTTRTATVEIEYRDAGGTRVDTDTAYVRDIRPGDTARVEETTLLDAEVSSGSCVIGEVG